MTDQEGLISLFEECNPQLPEILPPAVLENKGNGNGNNKIVCAEVDWQDDPVPEKWEKIRAAFYNGKTASEVEAAASGMPVGDWLELAAKMAPKQGPAIQVNIMQNLAELKRSLVDENVV